MALQKTIPTVWGVDAEYWRLQVGTLNRHSDLWLITICGFLNEAAYLAGAISMDAKMYEPLFTELSEDSTVEQVYNWLKTQPEFSGAIDC